MSAGVTPVTNHANAAELLADIVAEVIKRAHADGGWDAVRAQAQEWAVGSDMQSALAWQEALRRAGLE